MPSIVRPFRHSRSTAAEYQSARSFSLSFERSGAFPIRQVSKCGLAWPVRVQQRGIQAEAHATPAARTGAEESDARRVPESESAELAVLGTLDERVPLTRSERQNGPIGLL